MEEIIHAKKFTAICREKKESGQQLDELLKILSEEYDDLSRRLDRGRFQEAAAVRSNLRSRRLAEQLITEKGDVDTDKLDKAILYLKDHLHFPMFNRLEDSLAQKHILDALEHLAKCKQTQKLIKQFSRPASHKGAEDVIRQTLDLPYGSLVTDNHVRIAALSSWFAYLRQSVGSCFATAPALVIQCQMPDQFLLDLKEILETGRLKRTSSGHEYHAPISASPGVGDFKKPTVLRSEDYEDFKEIGTSPGLLAAFVAAGMIEAKKTLKEKVEETRSYTVKALRAIQSDFSGVYFGVTPENIVRKALFNFLDINEVKFEEWMHRPREMVFGGLVRETPHAALGQKGTTATYLQYIEKFNEAKSAFIRLSENGMLKTWEFTVASFAETKADFSKWNLYTSLGLNMEEPGGIGACLYNEIKEKLERTNQKVQEYQIEYEVLYSQLKYCEARAKSATTEKELVWLRAEAQSKYNEFQTFEIMRNREHYLAERYSTLFSDLINLYLSLFPRYFQEVYDAEVHDTTGGLWDDRPAGFRLLFKHGRMNTSQWSRINSPQDFSDALSSFFSLTESEISHAPHLEGMESPISEMVTRVINHVKTKEFLESSVWRMSGRHGEAAIRDPLDHLDKISKKPWAYTSGGNLQTLVSSYFKLKTNPREVERFVENEMELLVFLADTLKLLPAKMTEEFTKDSDRRMLMYSPTHAFNLNPGLEKFFSIWQNEAFTYTYVRDELIYPMQTYWEGYEMTELRYKNLIERLKELVPADFKPRFFQAFDLYPGPMSPSDLAQYIFDKIDTDVGLQIRGRNILHKQNIDEFFLKNLPLLDKAQALTLAKQLVTKLNQFNVDLLDGLFEEDSNYDYQIPALNVIQSVLLLYMDQLKETSFKEDLIAILVEETRLMGFLPPAPVIIADTNWPKFFFTFLVNPGSAKLELWRTDRLGLTGSPMTEWKEWLNGSKKEPTWGLLTQTSEYQV